MLTPVRSDCVLTALPKCLISSGTHNIPTISFGLPKPAPKTHHFPHPPPTNMTAINSLTSWLLLPFRPPPFQPTLCTWEPTFASNLVPLMLCFPLFFQSLLSFLSYLAIIFTFSYSLHCILSCGSRYFEWG